MAHASSEPNDSHSQAGHTGHEGPHVAPLWLMTGVFVSLLFLTWVTVAAIQVDLGEANIWIALLIAFVKASLVGAYFMHLRWDAPINGVILLASLLFVTLMITFAATDKNEYRADYVPPQGALISDE